uniref:Uncharacterized protein n=1 Tax=Brassica campestris TaxID=3711 RepID=M4DDW7_BRACM
MLRSKKKYRPPFALSFKTRSLIRSVKKSSMAKKKTNSVSLVNFPEFGSAASGSKVFGSDLSSLASSPVGSASAASGFISIVQSNIVSPIGALLSPELITIEAPPALPQSNSPSVSEEDLVQEHPITTMIQETQAGDLEEGEICQTAEEETLETLEVSTVMEEQNQLVAQSTSCGNDIASVGVNHGEPNPTDTLSNTHSGSTTVMVEESAPGDSLASASSSGVNLISPQPTADRCLEGKLEETICDPDEDQERDNPFILVKNRKSSRRAAKRH